jgi:outer membrane lipase/esterase
MHAVRFAVASWLVVCLGPPPAPAQPITQVVAFGDSLTDTGNWTATMGGPDPPYAPGRWSNGPLWVERLAALLGVPAPAPSLHGGTNSAYAGALTGPGAVSNTTNVPTVRMQVASWLSGHTPGPGDLIAVWGGTNDLLNGNDKVNGQRDPSVPVANLRAAVSDLAAAGGRRFVVLNLLQLGDEPRYATGPPSPRDVLNTLTQSFDAQLSAAMAQLQGSLPGVRIAVVDTDGLFQRIRANPAQYGFTNVTQGALSRGVTSGQGYLFWDDIGHPTTAFHQLIGDQAFAAAVPEPSGLLLLGAAAVAALGYQRRRITAARPPASGE